MQYEYECKNEECNLETVTINKPMAKSSKIEICPLCKKQLTRKYSVGIQTADGFKK